VRVPAFAWWPGVIEPGQIVGDIIHEMDLFGTFARLGGATQYIPTDRVIDGVDQTALLLNGDAHSRRDYVFIYAGDQLGATVKGNYKRHWISPDPVGEASGIPAASYFLPSDQCSSLLGLLMLTAAFGPPSVLAQGEQDIAKQSQNPVGDVVSPPFENNVLFGALPLLLRLRRLSWLGERQERRHRHSRRIRAGR
jgi:hypothetical protein